MWKEKERETQKCVNNWIISNNSIFYANLTFLSRNRSGINNTLISHGQALVENFTRKV